jgi:hypothetical protein
MTKWHQIGSKNNTANRQNQMDFIEGWIIKLARTMNGP